MQIYSEKHTLNLPAWRCYQHVATWDLAKVSCLYAQSTIFKYVARWINHLVVLNLIICVYMQRYQSHTAGVIHDDVIKWKHFTRYLPFVQGIHRFPVNSLHKSQWRGALMYSLICAWINRWVNNRDAGDLRCYHAHYDVTVMLQMYNSKHHSFPSYKVIKMAIQTY